MNKKVLYWILGIASVLVIAAWILAAMPTEQGASQPSPSSNASGASAQMDSGAMNHGQSTAPTDSALRNYLEEQDKIMDEMMDEMDDVERTDNASVDFLKGMIPHHESAVNMAESYLKYGGSHEVLAPLAENIIAAQTDEIEQMEGMIKRISESGTSSAEQSNAYWSAYNKLMDHSMMHTTADSLDAAFAMGMMMHHQMAVDMADAILPNTDEEDVKSLAQAIIEAQKKEISEMQDVIDTLPGQQPAHH